MTSLQDVKCRMIQNGWCPHQADRWSKVLKVEHLQYFSRLDRSANARSSHNACGQARQCVANHVNMRSYVTKHVENDCTCSMMGLPRKRLTEIIAAGGVPLVSIETDKSDGGVRLHIKRRTLSSQYVAISHVWSDGMGNPNDNALPVCQIRRLHQYLEALPHSGNRAIDKRAPNLIPSNPLSSKSVLFWMDTLCIPVGSAYVDLRMQSINRMASIYATAMQVLILDAELQKCRTKGTLANELLVRILGSNWMARSWTFQEGALGIDCIFQFADTALDPIYAWCESGPACGYKGEVNFPSEGSPDHNTYSVLYTLLWDRLRQGWKSPLSPRERPVAKPSERLFLEKNIPKIPGLRSIGLVQSALQAAPTASRYDGVAASEHFRRTTSDEGRALQLVEIWNELGCRTTSMTEDIHVIIANLLDFHAGDVMDPSGKIERMHAILLSFDYLPFSLFYDTGSKCKDLPNTWLPVEPSGSSMAQYPLMKRNLDGFLLMKSNSRTHEPTVLLIESNVLDHKSFHVRKTGQNESLAIQLFRGETSSTLPETKSCCLVIETDLFDSSLTKTRGALFRVTETKARFDVVEELRAVYCCPVEELRAVYCCPVEAEKLSSAHVGGMCIDPDDSVSQVHNAQKVHPSTKLVVEYGEYLRLLCIRDASLIAVASPLNFKPLERREPIVDTFMYGNWMSVLIVLLPLAAVGCFIALGVLRSRHPHSWRANDTVLLVVGLTMWFGGFLGLVASWWLKDLLAHRAWARSFDQKGTSRSVWLLSFFLKVDEKIPGPLGRNGSR